MGRLTDDMTRLVGEIHAGREMGIEPWKDDLTRLACEIQTARRGLEHATVEMRSAVARLRSILASDALEQRVASRLEQRTP
jgi:hypothetical protein